MNAAASQSLVDEAKHAKREVLVIIPSSDS